MATKRDIDTTKALSNLNKAYSKYGYSTPDEDQIGWEHYEAFREAMRGPVKTADEVSAQQIAKLLGDAIRKGRPN